MNYSVDTRATRPAGGQPDAQSAGLPGLGRPLAVRGQLHLSHGIDLSTLPAANVAAWFAMPAGT